MTTDLRQHAPPSRVQRDQGTADFILALENRDRYIAQSAATKTGQRAELPARAPIDRTLRPVA